MDGWMVAALGATVLLVCYRAVLLGASLQDLWLVRKRGIRNGRRVLALRQPGIHLARLLADLVLLGVLGQVVLRTDAPLPPLWVQALRLAVVLVPALLLLAAVAEHRLRWLLEQHLPPETEP